MRSQNMFSWINEQIAIIFYAENETLSGVVSYSSSDRDLVATCSDQGIERVSETMISAGYNSSY